MKADILTQGSRRRHPLIVRSVLKWYRRNGRDLPWRRTTDPYRILLSEIMLQQTQVDRVLRKYPLFRRRFPTLSSLAKASGADVIRAWSGLGYNSRAVRLRALARRVRAHHGGRLPRSIAELQKLPGVGRYTAHAVAAFSYAQRVPVVDTNVQRVLDRLFPLDARRAKIWELAWAVLPPRSSYAWNQGLMDLGALVCTARTPTCSRCPLEHHCASAHRTVHRPKRRRVEPSRDGLPDRIYRGRIVQLLRQLNGEGSAELNRLGPMIKEPFRSTDRSWLRGVLEGLERDRLVRIKRSNGKLFVSLPT